MSEKTKITNKIYLDQNGQTIKYLLKNSENYKVEALLKLVSAEFLKLRNSDFLINSDKSLILIPRFNVLLPYPDKNNSIFIDMYDYYSTPTPQKRAFKGFKGECMSYDEWQRIFYDNKGKNNNLLELFKKECSAEYYVVKKGNQCVTVNASDASVIQFRDTGGAVEVSSILAQNITSSLFGKMLNILAHYSLYVPVYRLKNGQLSSILKDHGFIVPNLSKDIGRIFEENYDLVDIWLHEGDLENNIAKVKKVLANYVDFDDRTIPADQIKNLLISTDKVRADLELYDGNILNDINRGHWELWNDGTECEGKVCFDLSEKLVARNPIADVHYNGTIAIDFGTKSTVVVCKNGAKDPMPMRIGAGRFSKDISSRDYENPTILEFIDFLSFSKDYNSAEGRPATKWEDLTVSHTAYSQMIGGSSEEINSFFTELKRWSSDEEEEFMIRDKKNNEMVIHPYMSDKNTADLIEIYAYYLGLYINNMFNGIYINYMISFPVNFSKELRDKLLSSFSKGLKKSLPSAILSSEEVMKKFRVTMSISEPAAYAACALSTYGFDPDEDGEIFYGVFDFGGGTTDFDFGVWKSDEEFDYCIEHFGAGGDSYLGGEMLLQQAAYQIFRNNISKCRSPMIPFYRPCECLRFPGDEMIVLNSQEARMNIRQVSEKIRPIWERTEEYDKLKEDGAINVSLFDNSGKMTNIEFVIDTDEIEKMFRDRIAKGINNFMDSLKMVFKRTSLRKFDMIHIFLAGNSCLSHIVREVFEEKIAAFESEMNDDHKHFNLHPPLGVDENGKLISNNEYAIRPTGKTGVAFGLIMCRPGGEVKVISHNFEDDGQSKFLFFVGRVRKGKFKSVIDKEAEYGKWYKFIPANANTVEIYYTTQPAASSQLLSGNETTLETVLLEKTYDDAYVYISAISPNQIKYVVGVGDDDSFSPLSEEIIIQLMEK